MGFRPLDLPRSLAWFNALVFAAVFAFVGGLLLLLATVMLIVKGGSDPGANLGLLSNFLPGYSVTFVGALIGAIETGLILFVLSLLPGFLYYRGVLSEIHEAREEVSEESLLTAIARIRVRTFALGCGLFVALVILSATLGLVVTHKPGAPLGPHLALLAHFLPGYEISIKGAILGAAESFFAGAFFFALVGLLYDRLCGGKEPRS